MNNFNKNYKYKTHNRCDDCDKFYQKELAVLGRHNINYCHLCHQRLRVKPRSSSCREYYKGKFIE